MLNDIGEGPEFGPISERPPYLKILVYGEPGVGKTCFAASSPTPLVVDAEHGTRSLLNHPELHDVNVLPVYDWPTMESLLFGLHNKEEKYNKFETIVVDSVSELQRRVMDEQLKKKETEVFVPQGKDYQENTERMRRFANFLRDLPINLVLTAHVKEQVDDKEGRTYFRPDVTPKLSQSLVGIMDVVGFMRREADPETGDSIRTLQVVPGPKVIAKSRLNLPEVLVNPNFKDLLSAI